MPKESEYKIIQASSLEEMRKLTQELISEGWQMAGPVTVDPLSKSYYHEMVYLPVSPMEAAEIQRQEQAKVLAKEFGEKYNNLDKRVKELLDINDINVFVENGQMFTRIGDKISAGISPSEVLQALKASKHCPMDLDEEKFLNEIEGLL